MLGNDRYEVARQKYGGISDEEMTKKKILKIKDNFRIGMISHKKSLITIFGHNFTSRLLLNQNVNKKFTVDHIVTQSMQYEMTSCVYLHLLKVKSFLIFTNRCHLKLELSK